ncbi:phosphoserine phosphatase 1 [mine drainage metagenome]|uniref:Phosphoserine phosphatase 1 n=1 Tax=mine drainage metagenome TaxID=410659 RepID=A0A1J5PTB3_9ZZZZ
MTLWLVRHAQPLIEPGVCYGALDVPADASATRLAAQALAAVLPLDVLVVSSPLQRCELLMQTLQALRPDLSYKTETCSAEINFGCWEGLRWSAIPRHEFDRWTADFWKHRFGGTESLADFMGRVAGVWDAARHDGANTQAWITHAGVIRAAQLLAQGVRRIDHATQWSVCVPGFGQWCCL